MCFGRVQGFFTFFFPPGSVSLSAFLGIPLPPDNQTSEHQIAYPLSLSLSCPHTGGEKLPLFCLAFFSSSSTLAAMKTTPVNRGVLKQAIKLCRKKKGGGSTFAFILGQLRVEIGAVLQQPWLAFGKIRPKLTEVRRQPTHYHHTKKKWSGLPHSYQASKRRHFGGYQRNR